MTTGKKLWIGFGTLTALLVLFTLAIIARERSIAAEVNELADVSRPRSAAAREMETHVLGFALGIERYVESGDSARLSTADLEAVDVRRHLSEYERLARSPAQREMARLFSERWSALERAGRAIATSSTRPTPGVMRAFDDLRDQARRLVSDSMQVDAVATFSAQTAATQHDVRTAARFALLLLLAGVVIAVIASVVVGGSVVQTEESLHANRELLRVTLASIGDGVITTDPRGSVTYVNGVAESLTGWSNADALDQPLTRVFRVVNEDTREPAANPADRALAEGRVIGLANHSLLIAKDSSERPIDDSAAPIRDERGRVAGVVLIFRDATVQRRAFRVLREEAGRMTAVFNTALDCIISMDHTGKVSEFNAAAERTFGYRRDEAIGRELATLIIPEAQRERHRSALARYLTSAKGTILDRRLLMTAQRSDGTQFPVELAVTSVPSPTGGPPTFTGFLRDITEQQRTDERLRGVLAELKDADRKKNEFLATLAHELRGPLAPLRNTLEIMQRTDSNAAAVANARAVLDRQLNHLVRLVDDLIDVSRITRNRLELRKQAVELAPIIQHAVDACRPQAGPARIHVNVDLPVEPLYLSADPVRLAQILGNLLNNACKYTERGGRITVSAARDGNEVVVRVADTGIGIPPDKLESIFEMFAQVDRTAERSQGGLGIGLTLVKRLVELHEGTIEAHSEGEGRGSEFVLRLPLLPRAPDLAPESPPHREMATVRPRRVLVVDDNRDSADSLTELLSIDGHQVRTAYDGLEAVGAAQQFRPEVVLLDIGMPKMDGYETCRRIRALSWGRDMLIVALTGWGQEEDRRRSQEAGFDLHLTKPVDYGALAEVFSASDGASATSSQSAQ